MAGARHHEVPQFLMKGFASRTIPKKKDHAVFVCVFRKNMEPFECSTTDIGVERWFYKHEHLNVDDEITEIEGPFANYVSELRLSPDGTRITDRTLLELVVHLTTRTKHLRDSIIDSGGAMVDKMLGFLSKNWREYFLKYFNAHPEMIRNEFERLLLALPVSPEEKAFARQIFVMLSPKDLLRFMEQNENYTSVFESERQKFATEVTGLVKEVHIKSLLKKLVSEPRVQQYQKFEWFVHRTASPLLLGDVCCFFKVDSRYKSIGGVDENIEGIFLPISTDRFIVGYPAGKSLIVDARELNEASAKVSREYFVCSAASAEMTHLQTLLGTDSDLLTQHELDQVFSEAIEESLTL